MTESIRSIQLVVYTSMEGPPVKYHFNGRNLILDFHQSLFTRGVLGNTSVVLCHQHFTQIISPNFYQFNCHATHLQVIN